MQVPGVISQTLAQQLVRLNEFGRESVKSGVVASGQTDSGATPTSRLRAGNVLALRTSTGKYVLSNDANADRCTAPSITSSGHVDSDNATFKLVGNHGTITVSITTNAGAEADWVTDLNADAAFANFYIASVSGTDVKVLARNLGRDEWFYIHSDTTAGAGFAEGETNAVRGTDPDIVVLGEQVDLKDANDAAVDAIGQLWPKGCFRSAALLNATEEAKAVLLRNGSEIRA